MFGSLSLRQRQAALRRRVQASARHTPHNDAMTPAHSKQLQRHQRDSKKTCKHTSTSASASANMSASFSEGCAKEDLGVN
jgi:hypothetical protein